MKKLIAILAVGAVVSTVALGMSLPQFEDSQVQQKIDARLHQLLVKARIASQAK